MGRRRPRVLAVAAFVVIVAAGIALLTAQSGRGKAGADISKAPAFTAGQLNAAPTDDWLTNGGSIMNQRYSALKDIDTSNVSKLKLAWRIRLGSGGTRAYSQEATPLVYKRRDVRLDGQRRRLRTGRGDRQDTVDVEVHIPVKTITTACCGFSNRGVALGDGKVFIALITGQARRAEPADGRRALAHVEHALAGGRHDDARASVLRREGHRRHLRR